MSGNDSVEHTRASLETPQASKSKAADLGKPEPWKVEKEGGVVRLYVGPRHYFSQSNITGTDFFQDICNAHNASLGKPEAEKASEEKEAPRWMDIKSFVEPAVNKAWDEYAPNRLPTWQRMVAEDKAFHIAVTAAELACKKLLSSHPNVAGAEKAEDSGGKDA